jgi:hypothetical protein
MLGYPVSTADARRAILKRIELLSFFADLRQTIGDGAESADDWADAVSRFVAAGPARVRSGDPKLPTTDELFWQTLVNPSFHVTRDILHEVQHELHSLPQASRLRQQDLRDMVYFIQHQVRVADVYEVSAHAALMDWDHAKVTWDEVWRAGRRFAAAVGWSRPEWRVVSYRFVQVVAPWILVAILALRQRGQEAWLQQTASSIASTLESIAGDLATNPELLDPLTGMIERRLDHLAPMLARAPRPPRLHGPSTESHSTLA